MFEMHPSEFKNIALAAAAAAERDGFTGTAEAWAQIARTCAEEASTLVAEGPGSVFLTLASYVIKSVAA